MSHAEDLPEVRGYDAWQVYLSALVGVAVAALSIWWASGFGPFYETLFRVGPTATGPNRGVGADWVVGNTIPALDFLVALVHAADVLMGLFILLMVFLHWAAFRRLANRMRQPGETGGEAVAADGGTTGGEGGASE
ncbi:hypothetical protein [Halobellus sp. EA9]|uniref:hypothetical protein n=1 Tax=Halobellus sp. EA9 TaxID=3421647 RepID=UPI003EBC3810